MIAYKRRLIAIAAEALSLIAVFYFGRAMAPRSAHDTKIVTVEKSTTTAATAEAATAAIVTHDTVTKYVDRIVRMPSGETVETKTSTVEAKARDEKTSDAKTTQVKIEAQKSVEYRDRLVTFQSKAPRFSIAANVSMGLDFKPHYGAEVGVRVGGPLWVTLGADVKSRAVVVGAALVF